MEEEEEEDEEEEEEEEEKEEPQQQQQLLHCLKKEHRVCTDSVRNDFQRAEAMIMVA